MKRRYNYDCATRHYAKRASILNPPLCTSYIIHPETQQIRTLFLLVSTVNFLYDYLDHYELFSRDEIMITTARRGPLKIVLLVTNDYK